MHVLTWPCLMYYGVTAEMKLNELLSTIARSNASTNRSPLRSSMTFPDANMNALLSISPKSPASMKSS